MKPVSFSPSLVLEMGCLMKAISFLSRLKNMEMALELNHNVILYQVETINHMVQLEVCFKSSEEAAHDGAAPEVRKR